MNIIEPVPVMDSLNTKCFNFVRAKTGDRDDSHNQVHAMQVRYTAERIYLVETPKENQFELETICLAAWLHDVEDHKYSVQAGTNAAFLNEFYPLHKDDVLKIIENVSYSKEVKLGLDVPIDLVLARDCVSDADKLEAIGKSGLDRCRSYTHEMHPEYTKLQLTSAIVKHADEKLLKLKDNFIRTKTGKRIAEPLHQEMMDELSKL